MRIAFFNAKPYERPFFDRENAGAGHEIQYLEPRLTEETAPLADGISSVCAFVNDSLAAPVLDILAAGGTKLIALRSAGFNNVDLAAADRLGLTVVRVPAYSPYAVAEHAVGLILTLNRKIHRAHNRVRENNFALDGLLGFDLHGRTVGVVGTGKIGEVFARIMHGFGCRLLGFDPFENPECLALGLRYVAFEELLAESDVVSLHCPLTPETRHLIDDAAIARMKPGAMLINTSRGAVIDTQASIRGLKSGRLGYLGLDVYEEEEGVFFRDLSSQVIQDDQLARLMTFPNVIITGHQAFFTEEALTNIAATTLANVSEFERTGECANAVSGARVVG
ncbi:MAG: 2-hydroxyacid dehydrogenase [Planctomycetaceae bacterium]